MAININNKEVPEVYVGSTPVMTIYNGSQLVWSSNPYPVGTVIANTQSAGSIILYPGKYELKTASAGGGGSWVSGWWCNYHSSGGSGAVWEGTFKYSGGKKTLAWTAAPYKSGAERITLDGAALLTLTGGGSGDHQNGGNGGVLTIDNTFSSMVLSTSIASNGTKGYGTTESGGSSHSGVTATKSTMGWGRGSGSNDSGGTSGGFYLKRIG